MAQPRIHSEDAASDRNVFADEHAISTPAMSEYEFSMANGFGMADGFRPNTAELAPRSSRISRLSSSSLRRSALLGFGPEGMTPASAPRPSSIAKDPSTRHSFTLANDGSRAPVEQTGGLMGSSSGSSSSSVPQLGLLMPRSNSGQRPISSMSRTTEVFDMELPTITRPQSSLDTTSRPAHPYALYQQSVEPTAEADVVSTAPPIQIGFPGRNADYHRQRGPDGEEQDIIGPDGHAEQLPAYTEQADENEKFYAARSRAALAIPQQNAPAQSVSVTQNEERAYIAPATVAPAIMPAIMPAISPASMESLPSSIAPEKDKAWSDKTWKEKRKTKVLCGIPLWLLLVAGGCVSFIAVVLGSVLGGVLGRDNSANSAAPMNMSAPSQMFDASPIAQPTGLGPIPTGSYFLPLGPPEETNSNCITSPLQSKAWSCSVPPIPILFEMNYPPGGYYIAKVYTPPPPGMSTTWNYGPQPPRVMPPQKLMFAKDITQPQRGPALYFQTVYDKTVVLQGDSFKVQGKSKRHHPLQRLAEEIAEIPPPFPPPKDMPPPPFPPPPFPPPHRMETRVSEEQSTTTSQTLTPPSGMPEPPPGFDGDKFLHSRKGVVQPGDEPWFCFWNTTFIEGFIYITEPLTTSLATSSPSSITASATPSATMAISQTSPQQSTTFVSSTLSITASTMPTTTSQPLLRRLASASPAPHDHRKEKANPTGSYPYPIKIVERRISNPSIATPYCQKMAIASDGSVQPVLDDDGNPLKIDITEQDPSNDAFKAAATSEAARASSSMSMAMASATSHSRVKRGVEALLDTQHLVGRSNPGNSCACRWLSTGQS